MLEIKSKEFIIIDANNNIKYKYAISQNAVPP